mgnify:CR=1 FL=1
MAKKLKGARPAATYRGARRNAEFCRKAVGNTTPAERKEIAAKRASE